MENGGVTAPVGLNMVALAAQRHVVLFVVLAGIQKFSDCIDFGTGTGAPLLHVVNPAFDYVPPKLVSLFITDT
ncbi:hypothetical protein L2E82_52216 [Cichorium intybus]|nr:hypothetical protein L2E82_52216 [Cichorium intybus]